MDYTKPCATEIIRSMRRLGLLVISLVPRTRSPHSALEALLACSYTLQEKKEAGTEPVWLS